MPAFLYLAPAASGKTTYVLNLARQEAQDLRAEVRVCLPTTLQARAWRRRLAEAGGTIGVHVLTFDQLYAACLQAAGESYAGLSEPVQYRLLQAVVDQTPLVHYQKLSRRPGFIQVLQAFIGEMKGARIFPQAFLEAIASHGDEPRLRELGLIYQAYQDQLRQMKWADWAGLGWLAVESLELRAQRTGVDWPLLIFDGFDSFTEIQCTLLKALALRVDRLVITLTGALDDDGRRQSQRRFRKTRQKLERALAIKAEPLPAHWRGQAPALAHLEAHLFEPTAKRVEAAGALELVETSDRAAEARAALRWLKERLVNDGMRPNEVALLARNMTAYRPFIFQIAYEYGLPVGLVDGLPLKDSPLVTALLDLFKLVLPQETGSNNPLLPRQGVIAAWRSPYFNWVDAYPDQQADEAIGITATDAAELDEAARWGRVIGGLNQWREALTALTVRDGSAVLDEDRRFPDTVPTGPQAEALAGKFLRFLLRLLPPQGLLPYREFVRWVEGFIGPDPATRPELDPSRADRLSLRVVEQVRRADEPVASLGMAALQSFKEVLRSLVWAEVSLNRRQLVDVGRFLTDLSGAVEAAVYYPPARPGGDEILVADVIQARGVPFRAIALLGLAEGEFPATLAEDPFLRETDRLWLRETAGLPLESSVESAEREYFYEAVTRPEERLLLTRPRLADSGAEWLPSPYWEEVCRLVDAQPTTLGGESMPAPDKTASLPEFMQSLVLQPDDAAQAWLRELDRDRWETLNRAAEIFDHRFGGRTTPFDGHLVYLAETFADQFGAGHTWSPSALESYLNCSFLFFISRVLGLQPRQEPAEGLDAAQLGTIYHRILEALYQTLSPADRSDISKLPEVLPSVAGPILDDAPRRQGFRETAWWHQTRAEIMDNVARSAVALAEMAGDFVPTWFEVGFFGQQALTVTDDADRFRLHGLIDRVDRDGQDRLRIIDYKTAGPWGYDNNALKQGKKIQLPLYALAARDGLGLGEPVEGFYWHIRQAEPSGLKLGDFGTGEAIMTAVGHAWRAVRGARAGHFVPQPPAGGCPAYCPAAAFCWRYRAGWGG